MNVDQTSTLAPAHETSQPASLLRRTVQRLTRGPAIAAVTGRPLGDHRAGRCWAPG